MESLVALLQDEDRFVAAAAAKALGSIGDRRAEPALIRLLTTEDEVLRTDVIETLGKIGASAAVGELLRLARVGASSEVAVRALVQILTRAASECEDVDLEGLKEIPTKTTQYSYYDDQYGAVYEHGIVFVRSSDVHKANDLAQAELARRSK